jgi:hypothetical protein
MRMMRSRGRVYCLCMRRLASIVALLLVFSGAAPVLACITLSAMSHEESACCRAMHGNCGEMAKMSCCRTEIQTDGHPQIATTAPSSDLHWVVVNRLAPTLIAPRILAASFLDIPPENSPPGLLATQITVLRI